MGGIPPTPLGQQSSLGTLQTQRPSWLRSATPSPHLEPRRVAPRRALLLPRHDLVRQRAAARRASCHTPARTRCAPAPPCAPQRVAVGAALELSEEGLVGAADDSAGGVVVGALWGGRAGACELVGGWGWVSVFSRAGLRRSYTEATGAARAICTEAGSQTHLVGVGQDAVRALDLGEPRRVAALVGVRPRAQGAVGALDLRVWGAGVRQRAAGRWRWAGRGGSLPAARIPQLARSARVRVRVRVSCYPPILYRYVLIPSHLVRRRGPAQPQDAVEVVVGLHHAAARRPVVRHDLLLHRLLLLSLVFLFWWLLCDAIPWLWDRRRSAKQKLYQVTLEENQTQNATHHPVQESLPWAAALFGCYRRASEATGKHTGPLLAPKTPFPRTHTHTARRPVKTTNQINQPNQSNSPVSSSSSTTPLTARASPGCVPLNAVASAFSAAASASRTR